MNLVHAISHAGVSRRTIYYWMAQGILPYTATLSGRQVTAEDLDRVAPRRRRRTNGSTNDEIRSKK